jgi:hypothetical protein
VATSPLLEAGLAPKPFMMSVDDIEEMNPKGPFVRHEEISKHSAISSYELVPPPRRKSRPPPKKSINVFKDPVGWFHQEYLSWRFYTVLYASLAAIVMLWNLLTLIGVIAVHGVDPNGRVTIYEGNCARVKRTNMYVHWFISVFGTGFLSASAYVMVDISPWTMKG